MVYCHHFQSVDVHLANFAHWKGHQVEIHVGFADGYGREESLSTNLSSLRTKVSHVCLQLFAMSMEFALRKNRRVCVAPYLRLARKSKGLRSLRRMDLRVVGSCLMGML